VLTTGEIALSLTPIKVVGVGAGGGKKLGVFSRVMNWAFGKGVPKGGVNLIPEGKLANHLFKGSGKLADNQANRSLIQNLANSKSLGVDTYGKSWYHGFDDAGRSIYAYSHNGVVKGAGYATSTAKEITLNYGLK